MIQNEHLRFNRIFDDNYILKESIHSQNKNRISGNESITIGSSREIQRNDYQLNVIKQDRYKKFFVKLIGYAPIFFQLNDTKKKIKEVIEDYLKLINVNFQGKIKGSFFYRGKNINLDETIEDIDHLSWITSNYYV